MRLRTLLVALPVLLMLPLLLHGGWLLSSLADSARADAARALERDVRALAVAIERESTALVRLLELMATSPALEPGRLDPPRFAAFAQPILTGDWGLHAVTVVDRDGRDVIRGVPAVDLGSPDGLGARIRGVFETAAPALSDVGPDAAGEDRALTVSVPVKRGAGVAFVLTARLDPSRFVRVMAEQAQQPGAVATLLDPSRRIAARTLDHDRHFGQRPIDRVLATLASGPSGHGRFESMEGADLLWAWTTVPVGWTVMVGRPAGVIDAAVFESTARLVAAGLIALLAAVGASAYVARRVTRTVESMSADAPRLLSGDGPPRPASGIRELDALYGTLRAASERMRAATAEQAQAARAERAARAEAEAANRAKDEFIGMLSHELRNPMAPIANALRYVERTQPLDERGRAAIAMASRQSAQLKRLVDDLLDATRIGQGRIELRLERTSVERAVEHAVQAIAPTVAQRGQPLRVSISPSVGEIVADPARLQQVLENLLGNAVKFTRDSDPIRVEVDGDARGVEIRVVDEGAGIDAESLPRIFDLFVQSEATLERTHGGLGIGLAWVRAIVALHGGTVSATSPGKGLGTTFTVRLPRGGEAVAAPARRPDGREPVLQARRRAFERRAVAVAGRDAPSP
ncbi:MAG TPA: sensor histidine kinase [Burkholderiaceae bacterium]|nr:sensor histidine kinase [Burkholderiaceae bacterium]